MVNTKINLTGVTLENPVTPASGTFGYGYEFKDFYDINMLGALVLKGTTKEPRFGNPTPRIADCKEAMLNSVGLQNPGVDKVIGSELKRLKEFYKKPVIANVCGFSVAEYAEVAEKFDNAEGIDILEINVSCPNVHEGGMAFGTDTKNVYEVAKAVKAVTKKPVFMKLTPNVTDITEIAKAAADGGADGISLINTLLGMKIDIKRKKPVLAVKKGGMSGRAILPIAVRAVYDVYDAVKLPIIGMGGVATAENVIELMLAGATAVEVGAENLVNPYACKEIIERLPLVMEKCGITDLNEIIGAAHNG